jgi:predicted esterase
MCPLKLSKTYSQQNLQYCRILLLILLACGWNKACRIKNREDKRMKTTDYMYTKGHLMARPDIELPKNSTVVGLQALNLEGARDGFMYVPQTYTPSRPAALALLLHGAGGKAEHVLGLLRSYADDHNIILLAPDSRGGTWDIISRNSFGADVRFIDQALDLVFEHYAVDTKHIAIGGFSDGASYALCIGLSNGDLFTHVLAFSPGFVYTIESKGNPDIFISHGIYDHILPIDPCSRRIVPQLRKKGLEVNYTEFEGEHLVPASISKSAVNWFTDK